jgi:ADP-ribose pyrophosphatase YjhB (NUDIX family)
MNKRKNSNNNDFLCEPTQMAVAALFDYRVTKVALILKNRAPKGLEKELLHKWNGLGGHVEPDIDEAPKDCILREIKEESDLIVKPKDLILTGYITRSDKLCWVWAGVTHNPDNLTQTTDELVAWHFLDNLPDNLVSDMQTIIPDGANMYRRHALGLPSNIKEYKL